MRRNGRQAVTLAVLLLLGVSTFSPSQEPPSRISENEIEKHFGKSTACEDAHIDSLEYFDFAGDGSEQAVVVASTCATGTAGPDVHAVLRRQTDGSLAELKIPEPTEKQQAGLFCRCFYDLS